MKTARDAEVAAQNSMPSNRFSNLLVQALLILVVGGLSLGLNGGFRDPPRYDGAGYAVLARSILNGTGYREIDHPNAPRHAHFPPGYPLALAGLWSITGVSASSAHMFSFCCTLAAILLAWLMFRAWFRPQVAFVMATALAINWRWARDGTVIQSEPLFLLISQLAILTSNAVAKRGGAMRCITLGLMLGAAVLTRHVGIALALAIFCDLLIRKKYRETALALAATTIIVAPWVAWLTTVRTNTQVALVEPGNLPVTVASNTLFYLRRMIDQIIGPFIEVATVFRPAFSGWATAAAILAACPILAGWLHLARTLSGNGRLAALNPAFTLLLLLLWPFTEAGRFLVPLVPFLIIGLVDGLAMTAHRLRIHSARLLAARLVLAISLPYSVYAIASNRSAAGRDHHDFDSACEWVAKQEQTPGSVLTRHPGEVFWQTGRTALSPSSSAIDSQIAESQVVFLLIDDDRFAAAEKTPLGQFVADHAKRVEAVFVSDGNRPVLVYRVKNPD